MPTVALGYDARAMRSPRPWAATLLVAITLAPDVASAITCKDPPEATLVFPRSGIEAPRNASVFVMLWRPSTRPAGLGLFARGQRVPCRLEARKPSGLVRLGPRAPLRPGETYEVRLEKQVLGTFRAVGSAAAADAPQLGAATIAFGAPAAASLWGKMGRAALVKLEPAQNPPPVVLEVRLSYDSDRVTVRTGFALQYAVDLAVASVEPCAQVPAAPEQGGYTLKLVPWSAAGVEGRPLLLTGTIE